MRRVRSKGEMLLYGGTIRNPPRVTAYGVGGAAKRDARECSRTAYVQRHPRDSIDRCVYAFVLVHTAS